MRSKPKALLIVAAALGLLCLGVWLDYRAALYGALDLPGARRVEVAPGGGARGVVRQLEEAGLCGRPSYLLLNLWLTGRGKRLKAGVYEVRPGQSLDGLIEALTTGEGTRAGNLTLREGVNLYELGAELEAQGITAAAPFVARAQERALVASLKLPAGAQSVEGYLFPATYHFGRGTSPDEVIKALHAQFERVWSEVASAHARPLADLKRAYKLTDHQVLTLASLVEREAATASERAVIARVFLNRLKIGKKLETDPTCVYPPLRVGEKPSPARCRDPQSAYSTYVIPGLPPGPISSVGRASLEAVLRPYDGPSAETLLYFVARRDGTRKHYFSASGAEHEQAVDYFLRKRAGAVAPTATPQPP
jgi:UPF0755 protein